MTDVNPNFKLPNFLKRAFGKRGFISFDFGKLIGFFDNRYNIVYSPPDKVYFAPHENKNKHEEKKVDDPERSNNVHKNLQAAKKKIPRHVD